MRYMQETDPSASVHFTYYKHERNHSEFWCQRASIECSWHNPGILERSYSTLGWDCSCRPVLSYPLLGFFAFLLFPFSPSPSSLLWAPQVSTNVNYISFSLPSYWLGSQHWPGPLLICFNLTGLFSPCKLQLGISSKANFQFFKTLTGSKVSLEGKPWHSKHPGIFTPTGSYSRDVCLSLLVSRRLEWRKRIWLLILVLWECYFHGSRLFVYSWGPWVVSIAGCCGSFNTTISRDAPPPCLFPTPPSSHLCSVPSYQDTMENENTL